MIGSEDRPNTEWIRWVLLKHRLDRLLDRPSVHRQAIEACLPETSVLVDQCRQHYALVIARRGPGRGSSEGIHGPAAGARASIAAATVRTISHVLRTVACFLNEEDKGAIMKQVVSMTLDSGCPTAVAQDLLAALVALADEDPAKILEVYASRLCFYCDSQSDPTMRDQVAEVAGMIRALEHLTRVLFRGGESDLCVQFLYVNTSSDSLGAAPFPVRLSEEGLNDLLCGRKDYPHVAQLINGCLASRLSSVRRLAYETLANVALFAKSHRGPKAFDMLLLTRLKGAEKDPCLVAVLAALVWEIVFVDEELQEERLVASGSPGSYSLLDDLFAESVQVRLVAFHSVGRLLFHSWIPTVGCREQDTGNHQNQDDSGHEEEEEVFSDEKELGVSPTASGATSALHPNVAACAEQALLRVALILHEHARKFDARIRAASRSIASGLRSRKRKARHLLARSALLVVDHGLANGSLDALRGRFSFARTGRAGSGPGSPTMSVASGDEYECGGDFTEGGGGAELRMEGDASSVSRAHGRVFIRPAEGADSGRGNRSSGRTETRYGGHEDAQTGRSGEGVAQGLGKDALQYAAAVHFLVAMLSSEDQGSVMAAIESHLGDYFDDGDVAFWGVDWLGGGGAADGSGSCSVDTRTAAAWLMGGVDARHSLLGEG